MKRLAQAVILQAVRDCMHGDTSAHEFLMTDSEDLAFWLDIAEEDIGPIREKLTTAPEDVKRLLKSVRPNGRIH